MTNDEQPARTVPSPANGAPAAPSQTGENTCRRCAGRAVIEDGQVCPDCNGTGLVLETVGDA